MPHCDQRWRIPSPSNPGERATYDIVLGVSVQTLNIDSIESILFMFEQQKLGDTAYYESEVITSRELKRLISEDVEAKEGGDAAQGLGNEKVAQAFRWKLFNQYCSLGDGLTVTMDIRTWSDLPLEYGSLDLHFVELCVDSSALYRAEHRPYSSWMIDINRSGCLEYETSTPTFKYSTNFCFSGDGRFAALVSVMGEKQYLEVWDLVDRDNESEKVKDSGQLEDSGGEDEFYYESEKAGDSKNSGKVEDSGNGDESLTQPKQHRALPVAWIPLPKKDVDISLSWDGSLLAVTDMTRSDPEKDKKEENTGIHQSVFTVYRCVWIDSNTFRQTPTQMDLWQHDIRMTCPRLRNYIGNGVFHHVETSNREPKDQLFVTCNGITIDIYSAFKSWTPLRSIVMNFVFASPDHALNVGNALCRNLRGRYFIAGETEIASTFDIVLGTQVSFTSTLTSEQFWSLNSLCGVSEDGHLVAIPGPRRVSIYRSATLTLIESYVFHELASNESLLTITFMCNDSFLYVETGSMEEPQRQKRPGYILDVDTMSVVDRVAPLGNNTFEKAPSHGSMQGLSFFGHTKLWHMRLEDRLHQSFSQAPMHCTSSCYSMDSPQVAVEEATSTTGLHFKAQRTDTSFGSHLKRDKTQSLTVTVTDTKSGQVKKMVVPLPKYSHVNSAAFSGDCRYLLVAATKLYLAWRVPRTFDGDFRLVTAYALPLNTEWTVCQHGHVSCRSTDDKEIYSLNHITRPLSSQSTEIFLMTLEPILRIYEYADGGLKQDIVRYFSRHLNVYPDQDDLSQSVLPYIAKEWNAGCQHIYCEFLTDLLSSATIRWIPRYNMSEPANPLAILFDKADTQPLAIVPVKIIVDYCLRQAKADEDPHFLLPIEQCLHRLVDSKQSYSELAQHVYRELAFFPARGRKLIIGHHALANPVTIRWRFWRPYPWGLHQYKVQVLQLDMEKTPNPPKGNFTRDIFHASFNMLWHKPQETTPDGAANKVDGPAPVPTLFSWPRAIWMMVLRKCRLAYNPTVECYPFEFQVLDNPALKALVEYKWNTIGFGYWLVRFFSQCCYYILVLTTIFLQIYGDDSFDRTLEGLFIAIIVIAPVFLWLELIQLIREKQDYLRVFKSVCHFVSIIIRAISSIRVFFFVFAGGLLAFSIAILHLLYTCVDSDHCSYFTEGFSNILWRAFSMTYFMMGGRYDPVSNGFSSNSFAFHMMMIFFFFFTVILMLNVLIALINNAINDGDQAWQLDWLQNRMRYIESAENMTYDIPGFRESRNYFPDTIYYTGSSRQVREPTGIKPRYRR
ncbi:hypothetical protein BGX33_006225 [Mortierella sp. NVP41]|nr:hypothetical protein BGX33_006225 [Mortierella sp. NVP41]